MFEHEADDIQVNEIICVPPQDKNSNNDNSNNKINKQTPKQRHFKTRWKRFNADWETSRHDKALKRWMVK